MTFTSYKRVMYIEFSSCVQSVSVSAGIFKAEQSLQGMEWQEKEELDEKHIEKLLRKDKIKKR